MTSYNKTAIEQQSPPLTQLLEESLKMVQHKIEVESKEQGAAVDKALANRVAKAAVVIIGVLSDLSDIEQERVLRFVQESMGVITGD